MLEKTKRGEDVHEGKGDTKAGTEELINCFVYQYFKYDNDESYSSDLCAIRQQMR